MATYNFLDKTGLGLVWAKIKALIPTKTSDLTNDNNFITSSDVPKEVMVVTITQNGSILTSNKTYAEIGSFLDGGGIVICRDGTYFYDLSYYNNAGIMFAHTEIYEDDGDYYAETLYFRIAFNNVITFRKEEYTVSLALLPDTIIINPTNGQYLKYDGSVWRNSAPPTDTTYSISISGNRITLTPSSGTASYIDLPVYNGGVST